MIPLLYQNFQSPSSSIRKNEQFLKMSDMEKLTETRNFFKSTCQWKMKYFVLENDLLKWYDNDDKISKEKFVPVENIHHVSILSNYKKRSSVIQVNPSLKIKYKLANNCNSGLRTKSKTVEFSFLKSKIWTAKWSLFLITQN